MLLLLQSLIDHVLSTTTEDHSNATRTSATSCLQHIYVLMKSKSDVNVNDFMHNINLDQFLFTILEMVITDGNNTRKDDDDGDFLDKKEYTLTLITLVVSNFEIFTCEYFLVSACIFINVSCLLM